MSSQPDAYVDGVIGQSCGSRNLQFDIVGKSLDELCPTAAW